MVVHAFLLSDCSTAYMVGVLLFTPLGLHRFSLSTVPISCKQTDTPRVLVVDCALIPEFGSRIHANSQFSGQNVMLPRLPLQSCNQTTHAGFSLAPHHTADSLDSDTQDLRYRQGIVNAPP